MPLRAGNVFYELMNPKLGRFQRPHARKENVMTRKYVDCREFPSDSKCTVTIAADSEKELMEVAVQHAIAVHGHKDTPEFRGQLKQIMKDGAPPP